MPVAIARGASTYTLQAEIFTLSNGMTVVLVPDHREPVVTPMQWYRVGSTDEELGKSGLAHFFEHLRFKGTSAHSGSTYAQTMRPEALSFATAGAPDGF